VDFHVEMVVTVDTQRWLGHTLKELDQSLIHVSHTHSQHVLTMLPHQNTQHAQPMNTHHQAVLNNVLTEATLKVAKLKQQAHTLLVVNKILWLNLLKVQLLLPTLSMLTF